MLLKVIQPIKKLTSFSPFSKSLLNEYNFEFSEKEFTRLIGEWNLFYDQIRLIYLQFSSSEEWRSNVSSISQTVRIQLHSILILINFGYAPISSTILRIYLEHLTLYYVLITKGHNSEIHNLFNGTNDPANRESFYRSIKGDKIEKYYKKVGNKYQSIFPDRSFDYSVI